MISNAEPLTVFAPLYMSHQHGTISPEKFVEGSQQLSTQNILEAINQKAISTSFFPVGETYEECEAIIYQHSWYKWALSALIIEIVLERRILGKDKESENMYSDALLASTHLYFVIKKPLRALNCRVSNLFNVRQGFPRGIRPSECYTTPVWESDKPGIYSQEIKGKIASFVKNDNIIKKFDIYDFLNKELIEKKRDFLIAYAYNNRMRLAYITYQIFFKLLNMKSVNHISLIKKECLSLKKEEGTDVPAYNRFFTIMEKVFQSLS